MGKTYNRVINSKQSKTKSSFEKYFSTLLIQCLRIYLNQVEISMLNLSNKTRSNSIIKINPLLLFFSIIKKKIYYISSYSFPWLLMLNCHPYHLGNNFILKMKNSPFLKLCSKQLEQSEDHTVNAGLQTCMPAILRISES